MTGPGFVQPLLVLDEVNLVQITVELIDARVGLPLRREDLLRTDGRRNRRSNGANDADFQCCA